MKTLFAFVFLELLSFGTLSSIAEAAPKSQKPHCAQDLKSTAQSPTSITTLAEWNRLSTEEKREILNSGFSERGIAYLEYDNLKNVPRGIQREFAKRSLAEALRRMPDQDSGYFDEYVTIGRPQASFQLYLLQDGSIAGGVVLLVQDGSQAEGFEGRHFATLAGALKAGVPHPKTTDVSWVWSLTFDSDGTAYDNEEGNYWEWTGF